MAWLGVVVALLGGAVIVRAFLHAKQWGLPSLPRSQECRSKEHAHSSAPGQINDRGKGQLAGGEASETTSKTTTEPSCSWKQLGDHARGPLIAITFSGVYPPGSAGNGFAKTMIQFVRSVLSETRAAGVIFDLIDLDYTSGNAIGGLATSLVDDSKRFRPAAIVAAGSTAESLERLLEADSLLGLGGMKLFRTTRDALARIEKALDQAAVEQRGQIVDDDFGLAAGKQRLDVSVNDWVDDVCFVCGIARTRPADLPRLACVSCRSRARVVDSTALLSDLLRPRYKGDFPLEGSLLRYLLNPVEISGHRGWAEFVGGGVGIHEEVSPSADVFDFTIQHVDPFRSWIRSRHVAELESMIENHGFLNVYARLSDPARANLDRMLLWWGATQSGKEARATHPLRSNDDAWKLADTFSLPCETAPSFRSMLARLNGLRRRSSASVDEEL